MDGPRDQLFARPRLAAQEDGDIEVGDVADRASDAVDPGALPDQVVAAALDGEGLHAVEEEHNPAPHGDDHASKQLLDLELAVFGEGLALERDARRALADVDEDAAVLAGAEPDGFAAEALVAERAPVRGAEAYQLGGRARQRDRLAGREGPEDGDVPDQVDVRVVEDRQRPDRPDGRWAVYHIIRHSEGALRIARGCVQVASTEATTAPSPREQRRW